MFTRGIAPARHGRGMLTYVLTAAMAVTLGATAVTRPALTPLPSGPYATDLSHVAASALTANVPPQISELATVPASACVTGSARPYLSTLTPQLRAQVTDAEAAASVLTIEWWELSGSSALGDASVTGVPSGGSGAVTSSTLSNGGDYKWRARAHDGTEAGPWSAWCEFTVDTTAPATAPTVGSTGYPERSTRPTGYVSSTRTQSFIRVNDTVLALNGDDYIEQITLPFPVTFYGQVTSTAWVDTNGSLYLANPGGSHPDCGATPASAAPNGGIYAFCDDLDIDSGSSVRTGVQGTAPNRKFIVEWRDAKQYGIGDSRISVEVIIDEATGEIVTNYADVNLGGLGFDEGESATVGVENANGTAGEQYSRGEWVIRNEVAVVFTPSVVLPVSYTKTTETMTYVAATTATTIFGDDAYNHLDLPFPFPYYGRGRSRIWVDTNGSLFFNDPHASQPVCGAIPDVAPPNSGVMAFCDDLLSHEGHIRTALVGTAPNRTFVVEWNDVFRWGHDWWEAEPHFLSFQIRLGEDGTITFNYDGIDPLLAEERGSHATIGIENQSGTAGVQHGRFEQVLANNTAVKFTPQYGEPTSTGGAGVAGTFTFGNSGVSDVTSYLYGLDTNPPTTVTSAGSVILTPATDGPHILYVRSQDRAGNVSPISEYRFYAGPGGLTSPRPNDITASKVELAAEGHPASTAVTFQWRRADTDAWTNIPLSHVTKAVGGAAVPAWPIISAGSGTYPRLVWDVAATLGSVDAQSIPRDGPLQVRAIFSGMSQGVATPVKISFDRNRASAASAAAGPGAVNLITGNTMVGGSDVSIGGLGLSRAFNTRQGDLLDPMFGPGWVSSVAAGGSPYTSLKVFGTLLQVGLPDGKTAGFTATGAGTTFVAGPEATGLTVVYSPSTGRYTLSDEAGNTVVFGRSSADPAGEYRPYSVSAAASGETATVSWEKVTIGGVDVTRPIRVLGPVPAGVSCTTMSRGCLALTFAYASDRVQSVSYTAWDPATSAMVTVVVARYAYDGNGRLQAVWDPRLDWTDEVTHQVKMQYTYQTDGVLSTITPPGQEPWTLHYTTTSTDSGKGRLEKVTRSALSAGTATTTVVYGVPLSGTGAPYDLSVAQTGRWSQVEPPVNATAVFPPSQIPNGSSYERATVSYLDANGRVVNTAQPGGHLGAVWFDRFGNAERQLTAGNRARALNASTTDTPHQELTAALAVSTHNTYSADGILLLSTLEPEHQVQLANGTVVRGRRHTAHTYDQGAPSALGLVTTTTTQVRWWDASGGSHDADARVTTTEYDWADRLPTKSTVDPAGLNLATRTAYDSQGRVIRTATPAGGSSDTTPATRVTVYYSAAANGSDPACGNRPEWDGLVCLTRAGGQPSTGAELAETVTTYGFYGQQMSAVESISTGALRTTTLTHDAAGRVLTATVSASGLGEPLQVRRNVYDLATGQMVRTQTLNGSTVTAEVIRGFDSLGRPASYTDADGNVSSTTYDLMSRPLVVNDGKATRTYAYDGGAERRGLATSVTDSELGLFTGTYDADGSLVSHTWPNGVTVTVTVDEVGGPASLSYAQPGNTLYYESVRSSAHGQTLNRASTLSTQGNGYDAAGRLTSVADTADAACTTRVYTFDAATNRTGQTTYGPGTGGACQTVTSSGATTWTFDSADRANTTGYTYDALGRTLTMPGADTAIPGGGTATMTYHVNDMARSINQGARTATYTLDVITNRFRSWADNQSGSPVTKVNHYAGDGDRPVWTDEGSSTWTRQIAGLSGIVAVHTATAGENYVLANLNGDFIATMPETGPGITFTGDYTENGQPRDSSGVGTRRYGWHGQAQRAADTPGGLLLMGARLYTPGSGRFLSQDPVYGGSANSYEYCAADPVGCADISGLWWCSRWRNWLSGGDWDGYVKCRFSHKETKDLINAGKAAGIIAAAAVALLAIWTGPGAIVAGVTVLVAIEGGVHGVEWWYERQCEGYGTRTPWGMNAIIKIKRRHVDYWWWGWRQRPYFLPGYWWGVTKLECR